MTHYCRYNGDNKTYDDNNNDDDGDDDDGNNNNNNHNNNNGDDDDDDDNNNNNQGGTGANDSFVGKYMRDNTAVCVAAAGCCIIARVFRLVLSLSEKLFRCTVCGHSRGCVRFSSLMLGRRMDACV